MSDKKIYMRLPDGRKMKFNTLNEMNKFLDNDEKEQIKQKKKIDKAEFNNSIFKKKKDKD